MAKKKSKSKKAAKAEPVKKAQKKKTSSAGWIIGVIIVIVVIIAIILLLRGCAKAPIETPVTPTAPAEKPAVTPSEKPQLVAEAPEEVRYCTINYAIGWPKNKLGTEICIVDGNTVSAQIMFSGKGDTISGLWFKITTADGKVKYLRDSREVKQGETKTYAVDVGQKIEDMIAYPIISVDKVDKSCLNQRMLIIKAESCVAG